MSGICSAHQHYEKGCRLCEIDNEPMKVNDFQCPECGETFEEIWHMNLSNLKCLYCDAVMEKVDGNAERSG